MTVPAKARFLLLAGLASALPAVAATALESHSKARLVYAGEEGGRLRAGVEITLDPGWKTYWRIPGEAGVPPEFDWSGSANAETIGIGYPAPHRFMDSGGETIGYKERVLFPVSVAPREAGKPVDLALTLHYAVCNDVCIPAKAELRRTLGTGSAPAAETELVREAEALVPRGRAEGLDVEAARLDGEGKDAQLLVTLKGEKAAGNVDIFVEGFEDAYFRAPEALPGEGGERRFLLRIDGLKQASALRGRALTLTVIAPEARLVRQVPVE